MSQAQAYVAAGYSETGAEQNASRLMTNDKVVARVRELQAQSAEDVGVTAAMLSEQLEKARQKAEQNGQYNAVVSAIMGRAKLHGLIIDKAEVKDVTPPKIEEVDAKISQLLAKASDSFRTNGHSVQ
jgi:phage terminase small subunit